MKRKLSLLVLMLLFAMMFVGCTVRENGFRFVFMTDIHVQPERRASEGFTAAIAKVNQLSPDFVITGGDLIMDALGQKQSRADSLYDLYHVLSQKFAMPVYNTLGNHEVFGLYRESGISPQNVDYGKAMFLKHMKYERTYYSFDHKGWHFIILDAIGFTPERKYYGHIDEQELAWLRSDLGNISQSTPIAVSTHIPFASVYGQMTNGPTFAADSGSVVTNAKQVLDLFAGYKLKVVLQGHLHEVEEINFRGVHYITGGAVCGGWWQGDRDGFPEGFVVIDVAGDDFDWHYQTYGWQARNSHLSE